MGVELAAILELLLLVGGTSAGTMKMIAGTEVELLLAPRGRWLL